MRLILVVLALLFLVSCNSASAPPGAPSEGGEAPRGPGGAPSAPAYPTPTLADLEGKWELHFTEPLPETWPPPDPMPWHPLPTGLRVVMNADGTGEMVGMRWGNDWRTFLESSRYLCPITSTLSGFSWDLTFEFNYTSNWKVVCPAFKLPPQPSNDFFTGSLTIQGKLEGSTKDPAVTLPFSPATFVTNRHEATTGQLVDLDREWDTTASGVHHSSPPPPAEDPPATQ